MKNRIINAANNPNVWADNLPRNITYWRYCATLCSQGHKPMPPDFTQTEGMMLAAINQGRWIVLCPYCRAGMIVWHDDPLFWCAQCRMEANHWRPMRVLFPRDWHDIELVLSMRIDPATRNWLPGETLNTLARENLEHKEALYGLDIA